MDPGVVEQSLHGRAQAEAPAGEHEGFRRDLAQTHHRATGEPVALRYDNHELVDPDLDHGEVAVGGRRRDERDVRGSRVQEVQAVGARSLEEREVDAGTVRAEGADQHRDKVFAQDVLKGHRHPAAQGRCRGSHPRFDVAQGLAREGQERVAGRGQPDPPACLLVQGDPQDRARALECPRHRRLWEAEDFGGGGHLSGVGERHKGRQERQDSVNTLATHIARVSDGRRSMHWTHR